MNIRLDFAPFIRSKTLLLNTKKLSASVYDASAFTQKFNKHRADADMLFGSCDISSEMINLSTVCQRIFAMCNGHYTEHKLVAVGKIQAYGCLRKFVSVENLKGTVHERLRVGCSPLRLFP
jgi:hypothetical protein